MSISSLLNTLIAHNLLWKISRCDTKPCFKGNTHTVRGSERGMRLGTEAGIQVKVEATDGLDPGGT